MSTVDVSFEVRCARLPRDYGYALYCALADALDWWRMLGPAFTPCMAPRPPMTPSCSARAGG